MKKFILCSLLLISFFPLLHTQVQTVPAIESLLKQSEALLEKQPDPALKLAFRAAELSQAAKDDHYLSRSYTAIGKAYGRMDDTDGQIGYLEKARITAESTSDQQLLRKTTLRLAGALFNKGNYDEAFILFRQAKVLAEKEGSREKLYEIYSWQGSIFNHHDNWDSASHYFKLAVDGATTQHDTLAMANNSRNLSYSYFKAGKPDKSEQYVNFALELFQRIKDSSGVAKTYKDIGDAYWEKKDNAKAIEYYRKAYNIQKARNDMGRISVGACDLAYMYALDKKKGLLDQYADEAYSLAVKTRSWSIIKYSTKWLSDAYEMVGDHKKALFYQKAHFSINDSINNRSRIEKNSRKELETDFHEKIKMLKMEEEKRHAIAVEKENNQRLIRNILVVGFTITLILLISAYRSYRAKKKAHEVISHQKTEVEAQKVKIEEKNKEITDSINYARFIQRSILPDPQEIMKTFPGSFGLYKPKDVVSGDFYWFARQNDLGLIAAADCTGHGVPGALMSMLGNDKLHYALSSHITDPGKMLAFVNAEIKSTLKQEGERKNSQDGMDIALCSFDLKKNILQYAGANRPLWLVRNGSLTEYKPTKASIGGYTDVNQKFATETIPLQAGDTIYISTDGFSDQFGGQEGKKLMSKNLKNLLLSIQHIHILEQEKILEGKLREWQGKFEQVDDILVIGIRI